MDTTKQLVNKVAQKAIITLDMEEYYPTPEEIVMVDLKDYLFKGLILKEADFREMVEKTDWKTYTGKYVSIYCSTNAIIPMWAYMVLSAELSAYAKDVACAAIEHAPDIFLYRNLAKLNMAQFEAQRVVVKGCGNRQVPEAAYVQITQQLASVARVVMYGEPCSTVPVFKKVVH